MIKIEGAARESCLVIPRHEGRKVIFLSCFLDPFVCHGEHVHTKIHTHTY